MKLVSTVIFFAGMLCALGQAKMAPHAAIVIIYTTNQPAPITIVNTSANGWRQNYVKQQSVVTNLQISCGTAKSLTVKEEKNHVTLTFREVTIYQPVVVQGKYGEAQKLQTVIADAWSIDLGNADLVQVNDEILPAGKLAQKVSALPKRKN